MGWLLAALAMVVTWLWARNGVGLLGAQVNPLGLAVLIYAVVLVIGSAVITAEERLGAVARGFALVVGTLAIIVFGMLAVETQTVQLGWVFAALLYALGFAGLCIFGDDTDLRALPSHWARRDTPHKRQVLLTMAVGHAAYALLVALVMRHGSVDHWVLAATAGRLGATYLAEMAVFGWLVPRLKG